MSVSSAARKLLGEFRNRTTLRAGSLIMTVFGDAVAPRGGSVWIGSLINVLEGFGVSERLVRTSMFRLAREGWLEARSVGRRSYYGLTATGARRFDQATHRIYGEPRQRWSGEWCLLLLAGVPADTRDALRRELGWLGFGAIGTSLMLHPSPDRRDLDDLIDRLGVADTAVILAASAGDASQDRRLGELAGKSWNLDEIDAAYAELLARFRPVYSAVQKARRLEPRAAFEVRTLLIHDYRRILLRDPLLPPELLPEDWHGLAAYQLCRNLYRAVYAAADDYLSEHMETADGPLPPPAPDFYERFGGLVPPEADRMRA